MDGASLAPVEVVRELSWASWGDHRCPYAILTNISGDKQLPVAIQSGEDYSLLERVLGRNLLPDQEKFFSAFEITHGKVYKVIVEDPRLQLGQIYYRRDEKSEGVAEIRLGRALALALYFKLYSKPYYDVPIYLAEELSRRMTARKNEAQDNEFNSWLTKVTPGAFRRWEDMQNGRGCG